MKTLSFKKFPWLSALGLALLLGLWEGAWRFGWLNPALVPAPSQLLKVFYQEIYSGTLPHYLGKSLQHYSLGIFLGSLLGIMLGMVTALSPIFRALQEWCVRLLRPIPPIAWIPFAIIWFGTNMKAAAFMIAIGVFWLNYFATINAVMAVPKDYIELCRAYGHHRLWPRIIKVILPAAAPGIFGGVRSGLGQGWMLVVAAELFGVQGIGQRMMEASGLLATDVVVVYMITIAVIYSATDWVYMRIENRVLGWQRT